MDQTYVEAILLWGSTGSSPVVFEWFKSRGFQVQPMRAGLLVSGTRRAFETVFAVDLATATPPISLPVPEELQPFAVSIVVPALRRPHT